MVMVWIVRSRLVMALVVVVSLSLGILIVIGGRAFMKRLMHAAPRVFPELSKYPNDGSRKRMFYRALNNWQTGIICIVFLVFYLAVFLPVWLLRVAPLLTETNSVLADMCKVGVPIFIHFPIFLVLIPLLTRHAIRKKLRHVQSQAHGLPETNRDP